MKRAQGFDEIITALAAGDKTGEDNLVEILKHESNAGAQTSEGLHIVDAWLSGPVRRFLASTILSSFQSEIDQVWNDTLSRIFLSIEEYDSDKSRLRTWIYNLARYEALDLVRNSTRATNRERLALAELPMDLYEMDEVAHPKEIRALHAAMKRLNDTEKRLLTMKYVDGLTYAEISEIQKAEAIPPDHLRVYANRALKRLQNFYDKERRKP